MTVTLVRSVMFWYSSEIGNCDVGRMNRMAVRPASGIQINQPNALFGYQPIPWSLLHRDKTEEVYETLVACIFQINLTETYRSD